MGRSNFIEIYNMPRVGLVSLHASFSMSVGERCPTRRGRCPKLGRLPPRRVTAVGKRAQQVYSDAVIRALFSYLICLLPKETGSPHEPSQRVTVSDSYEHTRNQSFLLDCLISFCRGAPLEIQSY